MRGQGLLDLGDARCPIRCGIPVGQESAYLLESEAQLLEVPYELNPVEIRLTVVTKTAVGAGCRPQQVHLFVVAEGA